MPRLSQHYSNKNIWILSLSILFLSFHVHSAASFVAKSSKITLATDQHRQNQDRIDTPICLPMVDGKFIENTCNEAQYERNSREPSSIEPLASRNRVSRRDVVLSSAAATSMFFGTIVTPSPAYAVRQSKRATAYLVDSTIPPNLVPLSTVGKERAVLKRLGRGRGTAKTPSQDDSVNLNNMMNKAVFGTINAVSTTLGLKDNDVLSGPGYASFVCLGMNELHSSADVELGRGLLLEILKERKGGNKETAFAFSFLPLSTQPALNAFAGDGDVDKLKQAVLTDSNKVDPAVLEAQLPLLQLARSNKLKLLAIAPETDDVETVRSKGLQSVVPEKRAQYVADAQGFIDLTQNPKFKLYTERSLMKDFTPRSENDNPGNFFAERILVHETAATAVASYAIQRPDSLVVVVAPAEDVRFMRGINGRIPRICKFLSMESLVEEEAVTTILLNPTALNTLSASRYLRLMIGATPETLQYQTKVADYLWFSNMPKVNMLPRMMNG